MPKIELECHEVSVVTGKGLDVIIMRTSLPNGIAGYGGFQDIKIAVATGTAEQYIRDNFPQLKYDVIKRQRQWSSDVSDG